MGCDLTVDEGLLSCSCVENLKFCNLQPLPFLLQRTHPNLATAGSTSGFGDSSGAGRLCWVPNHSQKLAGKVLGWPHSSGVLGRGPGPQLSPCGCRYSLWRSCFGESVSWERKTFAVCNSAWTALSGASHPIEGTR